MSTLVISAPLNGVNRNNSGRPRNGIFRDPVCYRPPDGIWLVFLQTELLPVSRTPSLGVRWNRRKEMERRRFGREFKLEAVRLVREREVSIAQAVRVLELRETQVG